jgi:endonuclease I
VERLFLGIGTRDGVLIRRRTSAWIVLLVAAVVGRLALADAYDPPADYYSTATGTDAALKTQLNKIIDNFDDPDLTTEWIQTSESYGDLRVDLQVSDADPNDSSKIRVVYNNGVTITKPTGGTIPGWDNGVTWNREHSWPQSRGLDSEASPDGSDMHHLFPSIPSDNTAHANLNFGGAFGAQNRGIVSDGGTKYYPGDADAGLIARAQFYMDVRYDGADSGTEDLLLEINNPADNGSSYGDLNRLMEWHFAAPPTTFERNRNQIIFNNYQSNRNPLIDHPEYAWSIFSDDILGAVTPNNSQVTINGGTNTGAGGSTRSVDLGRVFVGAAVPAGQAFTLNKAGTHGTYYEVTAAGAATSSLSGRFNAFRHNQTDTKSITVGLNTTTATSGVKTGTVTVDNLDITSGGCSGCGAGDNNDVFNVSLTVLGHSTPSFSLAANLSSLTIPFGNLAVGASATPINFTVYNLPAGAATANMDFDSVTPSGNSSAFTTNLAAFAGSLQIPSDSIGHTFSAVLNTTSVGTFSAVYSLLFSDENIAGALNNSLTLTLTGTVRLPGDYNNDGDVDAADYTIWRRTYGDSAAAYSGADGDGNGMIGDGDLTVWRAHFGDVAPGAGLGATAAVPEPAAIGLVIVCLTVGLVRWVRLGPAAA